MEYKYLHIHVDTPYAWCCEHFAKVPAEWSTMDMIDYFNGIIYEYMFEAVDSYNDDWDNEKRVPTYDEYKDALSMSYWEELSYEEYRDFSGDD